MNKPTSNRKSRKQVYIETLKKLRQDTFREVVETYKEEYNPMYDKAKLRRHICKILEIGQVTYFEALRQYADEIKEFKKQKDAEYDI